MVHRRPACWSNVSAGLERGEPHVRYRAAIVLGPCDRRKPSRWRETTWAERDRWCGNPGPRVDGFGHRPGVDGRNRNVCGNTCGPSGARRRGNKGEAQERKVVETPARVAMTRSFQPEPRRGAKARGVPHSFYSNEYGGPDLDKASRSSRRRSTTRRHAVKANQPRPAGSRGIFGFQGPRAPRQPHGGGHFRMTTGLSANL